jgi:hypothetical protein
VILTKDTRERVMRVRREVEREREKRDINQATFRERDMIKRDRLRDISQD